MHASPVVIHHTQPPLIACFFADGCGAGGIHRVPASWQHLPWRVEACGSGKTDLAFGLFSKTKNLEVDMSVTLNLSLGSAFLQLTSCNPHTEACMPVHPHNPLCTPRL